MPLRANGVHPAPADPLADPRTRVATSAAAHVGLGGMSAPLVLLVLAITLGAGIAVDEVAAVSAGLRVALIAGSLAAIVLVRLPSLFTIVITPPLAYVVGSAVELIVESGGPPKRTQLLDFATSWLVYGFPTIAAATAVVVIGAALRLRLNR